MYRCSKVFPHLSPPLDRIALDQLNLIVVDDDETLGFSMKRRFTPLFRSVHVFDNPEIALAEVLDNLPDVLITDNFMPQMSGVELITRLRARGFDRPIIGSTDYWIDRSGFVRGYAPHAGSRRE